MGGDSRHIYGITSIAFATVALAGLMFAMRSSFDPSTGPSRLIFAFEAVVIGGLGSLWGTLVGGVVLGVTQSIGGQRTIRRSPCWPGTSSSWPCWPSAPQGLIAGRTA